MAYQRQKVLSSVKVVLIKKFSAKNFAKVSYFRHRYFEKTKSAKTFTKNENENFRPNPTFNSPVRLSM
jgi:hypothetical protein